MIVTAIPNPSLGHMLEVSSPRRGDVLRAGAAEERRPAVARVVAA
ncbi:hypothetical protein [Amycolatopsis sp. 3B14]